MTNLICTVSHLEAVAAFNKWLDNYADNARLQDQYGVARDDVEFWAAYLLDDDLPYWTDKGHTRLFDAAVGMERRDQASHKSLQGA